MGLPAAKSGDTIFAVDTHIVTVPPFEIPTPLPHIFRGTINGNLSPNVRIMGQPAATVGSTAINTPPHIPTPPGISFVKPPTNRGSVTFGSSTVKINGKMAARMSDVATTCNDPVDLPKGEVLVLQPCTVNIG